MHLVRLALQIFEEAVHAVPLFVPVAGPVRRALDDPVALRLRELVPGRVARNAGVTGVTQQVLVAVFPGGRVQGLDRTIAQRLALVGNHQPEVDANHTAEATTGFASTHRRVEREQRRLRIEIAQFAVGAMQPGGIAPQLARITFCRDHMNIQTPAAALQAELDRLHHPLLVGALEAQPVGDDIKNFVGLRARTGAFAFGMDPGETAGRQPLLNLGRAGVGRQLDRESQHQPRVGRRRSLHQLLIDRLRAVMPHRLRGLLVEQLRGTGEQQLQMVVQLGHRADGRTRSAHRVRLVDRDRRRHPVDPVDRRPVHAVKKLPGIGRESLDITPLALGIQGVEHQARFTRTAGPGHDGQLAGADVQVNVL